MSSESSHNSLLMKKSNEIKLNTLVASFAKAEPNHLRFSELLYMLLDRCIFINRLSFKKFAELFDDATKITTKLQKKQTSNQQIEQTAPVERQLNREQFIQFMSELGAYLYRQDKNHLERVFEDLLTQKIEADSSNNMLQPRVLTLDQTNRKLLFESCIMTIVSFERDIRGLFNCYIAENYQSMKNDKRLLLTEREIDLQNKKLTTVSFVTFLKESEICPHLIGIDHVEDIMKLVVPFADSKESQYYHKHCLIDAYTNQEKTEDKWKHVSDPGIMFFEFELILARIAWDSFPKDMDRKGIDSVMERFFGKTLSLRSHVNLTTEIIPFKKHLSKLKDYDQKYSKTVEVLSAKLSPTQPTKDLRLLMAEKHELQVSNLPIAIIDVAEMLKVLEKQLPKLPSKPITNQQNPPPFKDEKIVIGQVPPPQEKSDDKGKGGGDAKKDAGKKDQQPARVFPWTKPPTQIKSSEDYFQQLATKLSYEIQPLSSLQRGTIKRDVLPCLISETLYPPQIPKEVEPYIIAGRTCTLDKNYYMAIDNYNKAYNAWKLFQKKRSDDLPENIELYFDYMRGSLYSSAGKDDHALAYFFNCRKHIEGGKLGFVNPDRALPFFGIGEILYEVSQYEFAARAFLRAREMRENVLGIEHVQTATVFNNLGACFFMLDRAMEALGYTQIAQAVFAGELGPFHERTMTARANLTKIKKGQFSNIPQYRKLWEVYEKDEFEGGKKKKKGAAKKK